MLWSYEDTCVKKTKITILRNRSCQSSMHVHDTNTSEYRLLRQQHHTHASWYSPEQATETDRLLNKVVILFSLHTTHSCSFLKWRLNHWCHMDYFNDVLTTFLGLACVSCFIDYVGSESSRISSEISSFVFRRWTKILWVWNDMRVSN